MSNIYYRVLMAPSEEHDLVINSNDRLDDVIEEHKKEAAERAAIAARSRAAADGDEEYLEGAEEGAPVFEELVPEEPQIDYVAEAKEQAEEILAEAREQANQILSVAEEQANAMKSHAEADGHRDGYDKGYQEALIEKSAMQREIDEEREAMQQEYESERASMEHDLVDVICDVIDKVFLVQFSDHKDLVLHLLDSALSGIEGSKEFLIRVNENNLEFLRSNKAILQDKVGEDATLDIVLDPLLDDGQCMIETDGGLFDCSMDTQMNNLIKEIRSLS